MAQNRTCNLSVTGRPSSPLRHVFSPAGYLPMLSITIRYASAQQQPGFVLQLHHIAVQPHAGGSLMLV
jgi:hypothetical protein